MNAVNDIANMQITGALIRASTVARLQSGQQFDLLIVGGGATGVGVALDAAARGLTVALLEAEDFAKGTSSRATKLLHGGVRYLAQGDVPLVREALRERTSLLNNAPHLAQALPFLMPVFGSRGRWIDKPFYGAGLMLYDLLAGSAGIGKTEFLSAKETREALPGVQVNNLAGSVRYWDGQFNDARLALTLARTAVAKGATVLNHCAVTDLLLDAGRVAGAKARDSISGREFDVRARCVINATGVWVDSLRRMLKPDAADMVAPSQGVHVVVDSDFLPGDHAMLVPKTSDGRVLFAVPWLGKVILGTTDTPREDLAAEPTPFPNEIEFILGECANYLTRAPQRRDVRSVWVGLRPLVKPNAEEGADTKTISREHTVVVGRSGLVTVTGGKWTTYRAMAEDVLSQCVAQQLLPELPASTTATMPLVGATAVRSDYKISDQPGLDQYGDEAGIVDELSGHGRILGDGLTEAMVRFAVRVEGAQSVEDVLARRSRLLFLDAAQAAELAVPVAAIIGSELGSSFDAALSTKAFQRLAASYGDLD